MDEILLNSTGDGPNGGSSHCYTEVKPWTRFFARVLDYIIFVWLLFILVRVVFKFPLEGLYAFLFYMLAVFIWVLIEAVLMSLLGTTLGKWLFGIKVRDSEGKKPGFASSLSRSIFTWIFGIVMGIPVICIAGMLRQYTSLTRFKATTWDKKRDYRVEHDYFRVFKTTIAVSLYAAFIILLFIVPQMKSGIELAQKMMERNKPAISSAASWFSNFADSYNQESSTAYSYNQEGYSLMNNGEYQKAKEKFLQGLDSSPNDEIKDTLYNNLSWACYNLGEYEKALDYSKCSLAVGDNDAVEYSNYGNALSALDKVSEAENAYKKAIDLDEDISYAYYGLGQLKYDNYKYADAIKAFEKYTGIRKDDPDGWCYLGLSYLYGDNNRLRAKECLEKSMTIAPESIFVIDSMANYFNYTGEAEEAEKIYKKALVKNPDDYELLCDVAEFYQNREKYEETLNYADRAIELNQRETEAYRIKAQTYFWQDDRQNAIETVNRMISMCSRNADPFSVAGDLYNNQYEYKLAVIAYNGSLQRNPANENAVVGKIRALYYSKHYTKCLEFAAVMENKFENIDIPWYIGDVYSRLGDSEKALEYYKKALSMDESSIDLITAAGWEYYKTEDFKSAQAYADRALKIDEANDSAKELKESIKKRQYNIIDQVSEFIEENYMYYKPNSTYESIKNSLKSNRNVSAGDLNKLFESVRRENDLFSFVLGGREYDKFLEYQSGNTVEYKQINTDIAYVRITNFTENSANEFLDIIDNIENTGDKYLVIDLRGNGGGVTTSGCDILDFLLPDSVVCNLIYKDGYTTPYYSDDDSIQFKHLFVLVDEKSASCSELVTLGLKTYLDNVTVIGRNTFGKGVGQILFEDKSRGFVIFIVNHYWNVREENISEKGIKPDRVVKGDRLEAYMKEVDKMINSMEGSK